MKKFGWGNAMIIGGIVGCILGFGLTIGIIASGGNGLIALILIALALIVGPRLIIKGIHQKAAEVTDSRQARTSL